jgi:hypothetical protein
LPLGTWRLDEINRDHSTTLPGFADEGARHPLVGGARHRGAPAHDHGVLVPLPLSVVLAMTIGQVIGTGSLGLYLAAIISDL